LTVGNYSIDDNEILVFELDSFKHGESSFGCIDNILLPEKYKIIDTDSEDSLVFEKRNGEDRIAYFLKK